MIGSYASYKDHYLDVSDVVEHNAHAFFLHSEQIDTTMNNIAENGPPEIVWDTITPMIEEENVCESDLIIVCNVESEDESDDTINDLDVSSSGGGMPADPTHTRNTLSSLYEHEARKDIMSHSEYGMHMRGLNDGPWAMVMYNRAWCKKSVINLRNGLPLSSYKIYLGGPGGTGKSHVIKLICWDVIYFLQQSMRVQPDEPLVLVTAPTGLAAFNIGGVTLHSAFMLETNSGETSSWEKQSTMQLKLANLALCVIDEIRMVGGSTFAKISETLKMIKQNTDDWGGVAMLAIGDFYQLPPVGQRPVYKQLKTIHAPGDMAPLLWDVSKGC